MTNTSVTVFSVSFLMLILSVVRRHRLLRTTKLHIHKTFITNPQRMAPIPITFQNNVMLTSEGPLSHESNFKAIETVCGGHSENLFCVKYVNQARFKKLRERLCADSWLILLSINLERKVSCRLQIFGLKLFPAKCLQNFLSLPRMIKSLFVVYCNIIFHVTEAKMIRYIHMVFMRKHWLIGNHPC